MIYHLALSAEWESQRLSSEYVPSGYEKEGFIHTCHESQLEGVYRRYYAGRRDLMLLKIDDTKLNAKLIEEPSTGGELYPHIYGPINKDAIVEVDRYLRD